MKNINNLENISFNPFEYDNFVQAIAEFLKFKKIEEPQTWSMGAWAKRLSLSKTASLSNILSGRKSISRDLGRAMIKTMVLESHTSEYMELLLELQLNDQPHDFIKNSIFTRLKILKSPLGENKECVEAIQYLIQWEILDFDESGKLFVKNEHLINKNIPEVNL